MVRNPARFGWGCVTLVLVVLAVGLPLFIAMTMDCAGEPAVCELGRGLGITFSIGVSVVIIGPLALGSGILWLTRKRYKHRH